MIDLSQKWEQQQAGAATNGYKENGLGLFFALILLCNVSGFPKGKDIPGKI